MPSQNVPEPLVGEPDLVPALIRETSPACLHHQIPYRKVYREKAFDDKNLPSILAGSSPKLKPRWGCPGPFRSLLPPPAMAGPPGRSIPLSRRRTLGGWRRSRRWLRDFRDIPGNAPDLPVQDGHPLSGLFPRPAATVSGVQPTVGAVADSGFAQFFTSPGNGTCACRTRYGGIPMKPGPPPTAHPPSTPSMMSSRITGEQTHRPGPRLFWPSAGPCREYRCRQILRETKFNHRSDHP